MLLYGLAMNLPIQSFDEAVVKLKRFHLVKPSRRIANARAYRFDVTDDLHDLIAWAEKLWNKAVNGQFNLISSKQILSDFLEVISREKFRL